MAKKTQTENNENRTCSMDRMQVTSAQVYVLKEPMGKTRALARVVVNDQLQLTGLRVVDGSNGLFVSYPNDPSYKGDDYRSLFYPVTRELRDHVEQVVVEKYQEAVAHPAAK